MFSDNSRAHLINNKQQIPSTSRWLDIMTWISANIVGVALSLSVINNTLLASYGRSCLLVQMQCIDIINWLTSDVWCIVSLDILNFLPGHSVNVQDAFYPILMLCSPSRFAANSAKYYCYCVIFIETLFYPVMIFVQEGWTIRSWSSDSILNVWEMFNNDHRIS